LLFAFYIDRAAFGTLGMSISAFKFAVHLEENWMHPGFTHTPSVLR